MPTDVGDAEQVEAVPWAADHDDPEIWVGGPTARAIVASRLAGRLLGDFDARARRRLAA